MFQICVKHKSWKTSLSLFFDLFHSRHSSLYNFRNQGLIYFHRVNLWFDQFTLDRGDFLGHFLLVKPFTIMEHLIFCYILVNSPYFCRILYPKYWYKIHFHRDAHTYCTRSGSVSLDEVIMKEVVQYFLGASP